ncbi:hypothetical protein MTO96_008252 [Rhipicephalus appendiculatus]
MLPRHRNPGKSSPKEVVARDQEVRRRQCRYYNQRHRARRLSKLEAGDLVWVTDMQSKATVLAPALKPRSYVVANRRRCCPPPKQENAEPSPKRKDAHGNLQISRKLGAAERGTIGS